MIAFRSKTFGQHCLVDQNLHFYPFMKKSTLKTGQNTDLTDGSGVLWIYMLGVQYLGRMKFDTSFPPVRDRLIISRTVRKIFSREFSKKRGFWRFFRLFWSFFWPIFTIFERFKMCNICVDVNIPETWSHRRALAKTRCPYPMSRNYEPQPCIFGNLQV